MSAEREIPVRLLAPEEAPLLIALIRRCYGETYIDPSFYDQGAVEELLRSRRLHSIGAVSDQGQLVGHMSISLRLWGGISADAGMTLVDPAFRGRGIARRVAIGLAEQSIALGLVGVHDYPVTVHAATQRIGAGFGVDTGLMLANMPADVDFQEIDNPAEGARTSSLIRWLPFGRAPERTVHLPERYREQIEAFYTEAYLPRTILKLDSGIIGAEAELEPSYDARRQTLRIAVAQAGSDLGTQVHAERLEATKRGGLIAHVDLWLGDSGTPAAVELLRDLGFSFAGLLPEYRNGDVLRLQWLSPSVDDRVSGVLSTDASRSIEELVLNDRSTSTS